VSNMKPHFGRLDRFALRTRYQYAFRVGDWVWKSWCSDGDGQIDQSSRLLESACTTGVETRKSQGLESFCVTHALRVNVVI
jgi:hypothetical protein